MKRYRSSNSFTDHRTARMYLSIPWLMAVLLIEFFIVGNGYTFLTTELKFPVFTARWIMGFLCLLIATLTAWWLIRWIGISHSDVVPLTPAELRKDNIFTILEIQFNGVSDLKLRCTHKALGDKQVPIMIESSKLYTVASWNQVSRNTASTLVTKDNGRLTLNVSPEMVILDRLRYLFSEIDAAPNPSRLRFCNANTLNISRTGADTLMKQFGIPEHVAQLCVGINPSRSEDANAAILVVDRQHQRHDNGNTIGFIPTGDPDCGFIPHMVQGFLASHPAWGVYWSEVSDYAKVTDNDPWKRWEGKGMHRHRIYIFRKERGDDPPTEVTDATEPVLPSPAVCEACVEGDESHH